MAVAEKASAAPDGAVAAPVKKGPPIIIIIAVTAVICMGVGFALMKTVFAKKAVSSAPAAIVIGETVPLDEFLINLADTDVAHYIKVTIGVGLIQGKTAEEFKTKIPVTRDAIVMVLSAKKLDDINSTAGKEALKKELIDSINKEVGDKTVGAIYFEGFATQ
jgi:flagellar FliL protein